jgi:hypothetical protein
MIPKTKGPMHNASTMVLDIRWNGSIFQFLCLERFVSFEALFGLE